VTTPALSSGRVKTGSKKPWALGDVTRLVVACLKDTVMYTAAVQALGVQDRIKVCDIVHLIEPAKPPAQ
jgi:hypothetical protein